MTRIRRMLSFIKRNPEFFILAVFSGFLGLLVVFELSYGLSCGLVFFQHVVFPYVGVQWLITESSKDLSNRLRTGVLGGGIMGLVPVGVSLLLESIPLFSSNAQSLPIEEYILARVSYWIFLMSVSISIGIIAAISKRSQQ